VLNKLDRGKSPKREPSDHGRAVGQYIGLLMERRLEKLLSPYKPLAHMRWSNSHGVSHEIDFVIGTLQRPVILIDSKYIKYQKHAREKANEIANMLLSIRNNFPSVRLLVAVLAGNFTEGSKRILINQGIHVFHITFDTLAHNMRRHGIVIDWAEDDKLTPKRTWEVLNKLSEEELNRISDEFFNDTDIPDSLIRLIREVQKR
jgi:hypothetical protein